MRIWPEVKGGNVGRILAGKANDAAWRKASLGAALEKVDSQIRRDAWPEAAPHGRTAAALMTSRETSWRMAGRFRVIVTIGGIASGQTAALQAAGLEVEIVNDRFGLVQGWIGGGAIPALAALDAVRSISPAWPAEHSAGTATSEGDPAIRADLVRQLGHDGSGVVVGAISDGIDSLAASRASGNLPAVTVPPDSRCRRGSGDEGTAMLEIVHDLAPGATLLFSGIGTRLEMTDAIEYLAAAGADVIVDDLAFPGEPFFEDGPIALTAADAVAAGVSYRTAAGNFGDREYLVEDYRPGPEGFHDFDPAGAQDILNRVLVPPGGELVCFLQWADPFGASSNDYDLIVVEAMTVTILDSSTNVQNGTQDPIRSGGDRQPVLLCARSGDSHPAIRGPGAAPQAALSQQPAAGVLQLAVRHLRPRGPVRGDRRGRRRRPRSRSRRCRGLHQPGTRPHLLPGTDRPAEAGRGGVRRRHDDGAGVRAVLRHLGRGPAFRGRRRADAERETEAVAGPGPDGSRVHRGRHRGARHDRVEGHGRIDALAAVNAVPTSTTTTTISTTTTMRATTTVPTTTTVVSTTSTTLPACDPVDCDSDVCTVGDSCVGGACRPGDPLTAGRLSELVRSGTNSATTCAGDRRKSVRQILGALTKAARLVGQASSAASEKKRRKKLSQA